ncbi:MAG TPA: ATP-binding protein [Halobacteriales archaeon]|nr:ATP-binding protein [Halobacteriales archaeon]
MYVDANGVEAAVDRVRRDESIELVRAENGADAVKLLKHTAAAAVVVPFEPPDTSLTDLVDRLTGIDTTVAVLVIGDVPDLPRDVWVIPEGASPDTAYNRLLAALGDRRIDTALDRYARLAIDAIDVAEAAVNAEDLASIERAVHDGLMASSAFRFAWFGRPVGESIELTVGYPSPGRFAVESVADATGARSSEFLTDAIETGEVTVQRGDSYKRGKEATGQTSDDAEIISAIPFTHDERTYGILMLGIDDPDAFDSSERALLAKMGRVVGYVMASKSSTAPSGDSDLDRISEFVSFFSHEIRNPLSIAIAYLELARDEDDEEALNRVAGALETIEGFVDSAASILQPGRVDEVVEVSLASAATSAWRELETPEAELQIADRPTIKADPDLLERVLSNLYRNALEHGGPAVRIRVGALADGFGFFVEDDGPGIPEADRERIFEWGFSTSEEGQGIGLGLVSRVAEAHGWEIDVLDAADGGARFEVHTERPIGSGLDALFDAWDHGANDGSGVFT